MPVPGLGVVAFAIVCHADPAVLISQLGAKGVAEREAAAAALERLGPEALPALRAALDGQAPEVRNRAVGVIRKISINRLMRPTPVSLDFRDRPMSEVIRTITAETGCPLRIYERQTDWLAQRITLAEPAPLPFWQAVDRICAAGRFQSNLGSGPDGVSVSLFRDEIPGPASDHGIFRVQLEEIYYNGRYRRLHLMRDHSSSPISREEDRENSFVKLRVMTEPRMMIRNDGAIKGLVVIDDLGQSALPANPEAEQRRIDFGYSSAAYVLGQVPLKRVERPGRAIRTLRGIAPVVIADRRPDPLVIPLEHAEGRSFRSDESVVTVLKVTKVSSNPRVTIVEPFDPEEKEEKSKGLPSEAMAIDLSIRPSETVTPSDPAPASRKAVGRDEVLDLSEEQFEVLDAAGKAWSLPPWWISGNGPRRQAGEIRIRLIPADGDLSPCPWPGNLAGVRLRYYDMTTVRVEVPFQFTEVPLP